MAPELRPSKRRKKDLLPQLNPSVRETGASLRMRVTSGWAERFGLEKTTFMEFEKLEYVLFNSKDAAYLYYISSCLFNVCSTQITIYYSVSGEDLRDDSDTWEPVEI